MKRFLKYILILVIVFSAKIFDISVWAIGTEKIDYTETLESFENPERGFYQYFYYNFKVSGNEVPKSDRLDDNLIHLRLGIGDFSKQVNGDTDLEFSNDMLEMFSQILKTIKNNGGTAIIRFSYDNFDGEKNKEPALDMMLRHIEQLKPIFEENKDVISYIELGFFGPWGEMHSSDICTTDNVSRAIDKMLESVPVEIKIGVRQPKYYVAWANIERSLLDKDITVEGSNNYRIGLYNDGYLGSESDLGTFKNRDIEIKWLEKQAIHTLYGGEVVGNRATGEPLNTVKYMAEEAFRTHTTYLNKAYDQTVIESWKSEIYNGNDSLYKGKSGYIYINNHLGYRFVLRKSEITETIKQNENLNININIENVGFANLVNSKMVTLVLVKDNVKKEIKTKLDPTKWDSTKITNMNFDVELPNDISIGEWKLYLRISKYGDLYTDNNYQCIRLANNNLWDQDIGANYIGKFTIIEVENDIEQDDIVLKEQIYEQEYNKENKPENDIKEDVNKNNIQKNEVNNIQYDKNTSEVIKNNKKEENVSTEMESIQSDKITKDNNYESDSNISEVKSNQSLENETSSYIKVNIFIPILFVFVILIICFFKKFRNK